MTELEKKYEWYLAWPGRHTDPVRLQRSLAYMLTLGGEMKILQDSQAKLIGNAEWQQMVSQGLIAPAYQINGHSYGDIKPDEIGLAALFSYQTYTQTWEHVENARNDFDAGWLAREAYLEMLADWDEALVEEQWRQYGELKYQKRVKRGDTPENEPPVTEYVWQAIDRVLKRGETA